MASSALSRITGVVLSLPEPRRGISKSTNEPWEIRTANVLVAAQNVTTVQLPRVDRSTGRSPLHNGDPIVGEVVDYLVEFTVYGQDVQARVISEFPVDASLPESLAA